MTRGLRAAGTVLLCALLAVPGLTPAPAEAAEVPALTQISLGRYHAVAVDAAGQAWAWGMNNGVDPTEEDGLVEEDFTDYGALGNGHLEYGGLYPNRVLSEDGSGNVAALTGILKVAASRGFSVALDDSGQVWTWGRDDAGQLGDGDISTDPSPYARQVSLPEGIADIAAGERHILAVGAVTGKVYAWGDNDWGQLGNGASGAAVVEPAEVLTAPGVPLTGVERAFAGDVFSFALTGDGRLYAWGSDQYGETGLGDVGAVVAYAVEVTSLTNVQAVYTGWAAQSVYAAVGEGDSVTDAVYGWGNEPAYLLDGSGDTPQYIEALTALQPESIAVGFHYMLVAAANGDVYGGGQNYEYQLTFDFDGPGFGPIPKLSGTAGKGVDRVVAGYRSSLARTSDGGWLGWGYNDDAQLGTENWGWNLLMDPTAVREMTFETFDWTVYLSTSDGTALAEQEVRLSDYAGYGAQSGYTDSDGRITFTSVMPMEHELLVLHEAGLYNYADVVPSAGEDETYLTVVQSWEPYELKLYDDGDTENHIVGSLSWSGPEGDVPADQRYEAYFVDAEGDKLEEDAWILSYQESISQTDTTFDVAVPAEAAGIRLFVTRPSDPSWGERPSAAWALIPDYPTRAIGNPRFYDANAAANVVDGRVRWDAMDNETGIAFYDIFLFEYESETQQLVARQPAGEGAYAVTLPSMPWNDDAVLHIRATDGKGHYGNPRVVGLSDSRVEPPGAPIPNGLSAPSEAWITDDSPDAGVSGMLYWHYWIPSYDEIESERPTGFNVYSMREVDGEWEKVSLLAFVPVNSYLGGGEMSFSVYFPSSPLEGATHFGIFAAGEDDTESAEGVIPDLYPYAYPIDYNAIFQAIDANNDGSTNIMEIGAFLRTDGADLDGDGSLSMEEALFLLKHFITPTAVEPYYVH